MPEHQPDQPDRPIRPDGRARLLAALRRPGSRAQAVAGLLLAVLGFAAVTQVQATEKDDDYVGAREGDLVQLINNLELATTRAEREIADLREARDALGSDTEARRTAVERAREEADTLGILAGTIRAEGPGIRVRVTDPGASVGTNQLLNGLQELRDAGAEVIELDDEVRVVAQTALQDTSGGGVLVDGVELDAPYVIEAIGDPQTLESALQFTGGFVDEVEEVGGEVEIRRLDNVRVDSVREPEQPQYAEPGGGG